MNIKVPRILTTIVVAATIGLGIGGCGVMDDIKNFDGNIGEEQVRLYRPYSNRVNIQVIKPDGTVVIYQGENRDLTVDSIITEQNSVRITYTKDEIGSVVLQVGQEKYLGYVHAIKVLQEPTQEKGLAAIGKP